MSETAIAIPNGAERQGGDASAARPPARWRLALKESPQYLAPLLCFSFGVLLLLFVNSPTDGGWQLYARDMLSGKKLYSDLHYNQQPLFPLLVAIYVSVSFESILADKLAFIPELAVYTYLVYRLCRLSEGNAVQVSILTITVFFTASHFVGFRFDDYHVLAQMGVLCSFLVAWQFLQGRVDSLAFAATQSLIGTLTFLTKPNEGLAIAAVSGALFLSRERRIVSILKAMIAASVIALVAFAVVMFAISDSAHAWFNKSLLDAPSAKGGSLIILYPLWLFKDSAAFLRPADPIQALALAAPVPLLLGSYFALRTRRLWATTTALGLAIYLMVWFELVYGFDFVRDLTPVCLFASSAATTYVLFKVIVADDSGVERIFRSNLPLFLFPLFLFLVGSVSSGGKFTGTYLPLALTIALIPMIKTNGASVLRLWKGVPAGYYVVCIIISLAAFAYRFAIPYHWLSYGAEPFFENQMIIVDRRGNPYITSRRMDSLLRPVCQQVRASSSLLSLPYSAANYYCGIAPWHGYVQTFFDTSTAATIKGLLSELRSSPPDYVFYQRQLLYLRGHEIAFNGGAPLPHRELDHFIMRWLAEGRWKVVYRSHLYAPSTWLLIKTH